MLCHRCKWFIGQELYGSLHCKKLGRIPTVMIRCIYFEPKENEEQGLSK